MGAKEGEKETVGGRGQKRDSITIRGKGGKVKSGDGGWLLFPQCGFYDHFYCRAEADLIGGSPRSPSVPDVSLKQRSLRNSRHLLKEQHVRNLPDEIIRRPAASHCQTQV